MRDCAISGSDLKCFVYRPNYDKRDKQNRFTVLFVPFVCRIKNGSALLTSLQYFDIYDLYCAADLCKGYAIVRGIGLVDVSPRTADVIVKCNLGRERILSVFCVIEDFEVFKLRAVMADIPIA